MTTLIFLLSAAAAYARHPSLEVTEPSAHAGELVHFSISGVDGQVTYGLEVGDKAVLEGTGDGAVSATFTMPDLGDDVRTVAVEAEIWGSGKRKKVKRKLEYLGLLVQATGPSAPAPPPPAPAAAPQATPSPQPIQSPNGIEGTPAPALTPPSGREPRQSRKRLAIESPRHTTRGGELRRRAHRGRERANPDARVRNIRSKRPGPRTAPLFDGIPEPGAGDGNGPSGLKAIAPRKAALAPSGARLGDGSGHNAAVVVPALLGLAALALAGTAVLRRRRLASRPERD